MIPADLTGRRVLVTGGAGFIGSHLVDALVEIGANVRVLDNFETGRRENIAHHGGRVEVVEGTIRDIETCQRACEGVDTVFHQAALGSVPRSLELPADSFATNVGGTANVFTAARDQKARRVVYASSSSVYGDSEVLPKREGSEGQPLSPYALSKAMNEELAELYGRVFDMELIGLRYFNIYGPRQDPKGPYAAVIPRFFAACSRSESPLIYGDGTQSRDFTFVGDAVQANLKAAVGPHDACGRAYNIGAAGQTTVKELADLVIDLCGGHVRPEFRPPRVGDVLHSNADVTAARDAFGYDPATSLREGLAKARDHYLGT